MASKTKKYRIALGADHAGFLLKNQLAKTLKKQGHKIADVGTDSKESTDYPDYAIKVAKLVASGKYDRGLLACGSGIGMAIAANKVKKIRAAAC